MLLIHVYNLDLLVSQDFQVIRRITDSDLGNIQKFQMLLFPDFNYESNPFVLVTGVNGLNVLNMKTGYMQRLMNLKIYVGPSQEIAFFMKE